MRRLAALGALLALGCSPATYAHGVPNLARVSDGVWRSGQPASKEAWEYLWQIGVRRVVKLNYASEGSDDGAVLAGMTVQYLPIEPSGDLASVFVEPDREHVEEAVRWLSAGGGVLVHCTHGQDRTGLVVGAYRVEKGGWTKGQAHREMLEHGFHVLLPGLDLYWQDDVQAP